MKIDNRYIERFHTKYTKQPSGCWEWNLALDKNGYGLYTIERKQIQAHRFTFLADGIDIKGKHVCHKCDNPSCVNPEHLFVGSALDNNRDKVSKNRQSRGMTHGKSKLTNDDIIAIREEFKNPRRGLIRTLCKKYNISYPWMKRIQNNTAWTHI